MAASSGNVPLRGLSLFMTKSRGVPRIEDASKPVIRVGESHEWSADISMDKSAGRVCHGETAGESSRRGWR